MGAISMAHSKLLQAAPMRVPHSSLIRRVAALTVGENSIRWSLATLLRPVRTTLASIGGYTRPCVLRVDDYGYKRYEILMNSVVYLFDDSDLPEEIKYRLGVINLTDGPYKSEFSQVCVDDIFTVIPEWVEEYPHMTTIGWRLTESYYTIVLPNNVIDKLTAKREDTDDTRETGQDKSEENP